MKDEHGEKPWRVVTTDDERNGTMYRIEDAKGWYIAAFHYADRAYDIVESCNNYATVARERDEARRELKEAVDLLEPTSPLTRTSQPWCG